MGDIGGGSEGEPCTPWPRATRPHTSSRHPSCLVVRSRVTCFRMRQFTHPILSLPSRSKLLASASVKQTTAVCTPPKRLYSLHWSPRSGLPRAMHSAATTSSLVPVSSRSLTSWDLFETKYLISAFFLSARSSAFSKAETSSPFLKTRKISSLLVLQMERTSAPAFWGFTFAFIAFMDTLIASPDLGHWHVFTVSNVPPEEPSRHRLSNSGISWWNLSLCSSLMLPRCTLGN